MVNEPLVKKAEIHADLTGTVPVDETESVTFLGEGSDRATATVTRTANGRAQVELPQNTKAETFGSVVKASATNRVTVHQSDAAAYQNYPKRAYVVFTNPDESVTADGYTFTSTAAADRKTFFLGGFAVDIVNEEKAVEIINADGGTDKKAAHYTEDYTVTLKPKKSYEFDMDQFAVTVKANDTDTGGTVSSKAQGNFDQVCTQLPDGAVKVTVKAVRGGMVIDPAGKRQMTNLTMNVSGSGIYKVVDMEDGTDYTPVTQNAKTTFQVPKNAKLGITFTPKDFSKPYYEAYTKEKGSSFSLLAELKDTTGGTSYDLAKKADGSFADGVSFDWVTKSYTVAYTATEAQNTLEAVFAKSHVFRVFLSGGTAQITALDATGSALLHRDHDDPEADAHHVIVRDGTSLKVVMQRNADNTDKNTFTAYWAVVDNGTQTRGEDLPDKDTKLVSPAMKPIPMKHRRSTMPIF